jgi:SAM-dependent methyltransferase
MLAMSEIDRNVRARAQGLQYDAVADRVASLRPGRVLDWGAGWGQITHRLRERGIQTEAYDYWADAPAGIDCNNDFGIEVRHSQEPVRLPYADGEFSLALSCGVLEHVSDPSGSLQELHRVLAPGGRLVVYNLPNRYSYLERIAKWTGRYYHGQLEHDQVYTAGTARSIVAGAGFRLDAVRRTNLLPLSIPHPALNAVAVPVWAVNRALRYVPGLSLVATSIEIDATRPA